ncbi:MAG: SPOR domain-containing protein [Bacteroidota bacterium]|nr:SPOR domain-containing protein [Bacteroidota bacterium]
MQPFNSNINNDLEEVLQEVLIRDGNLVLPYFGSLHYRATEILHTQEHLEFKRNIVSFEANASASVKTDQIKTISRRLKLSEFESKVVLNRWLGNVKSSLRTNTVWSSNRFGKITHTERGIQVLLNQEAFKNEDYAYFGFASVAMPKTLVSSDSTATNAADEKEEFEHSNAKIVAIGHDVEQERNENKKEISKQVAQTSPRALAASFILGVITLSLFSFEGNRVGSPVYNMLHPVQQASQPISEKPSEDHSFEIKVEENTPESTLDHGLPLDTEEIESTPDIPAATKETKDDIISNDEVVVPARDGQDNRPKVYVVLGSFSQKENADRAIIEFESLNVADKIQYKFNGTYYRVGLYISENEWQQANKKHGLPFWILQ